MVAQLTVMDVTPVPVGGLESPEPSLVVTKLARLSIVPVPQVMEPVLLVMWTVKLFPASRSVVSQVRVPAGIVHSFPTRRSSDLLQDRPALVGTTSVILKP